MYGTDTVSRGTARSRHSSRGLLGICAAALLASLAAMPGTALAEGSRSLYPSGYGGSGAGRANLNLDDGQTYLGIIPARTFLYVYAQAGEHILVGSRNRTGAGVGKIQVFDPQDFGTRGNETIPGSADFTCTSGTDGLIADRDAELAGPNSADGSQTVPNGYTPCAYQAPVSGIYGVLFGGGSSGSQPDGSIDTPSVRQTSASAWDVTVRSSDTTSLTDIDGRVFTYAFAAYTGGNGDGRRIYSSLYYVTDDGYRYAQIFRGMDPNAAVFYSNPQGFLDQGEPLYKDVRSSGHYLTGGFRPNGISGLSAQQPQYPIFFSDPMTATGFDATRTALGIPAAPPSPQVADVSFSYPPTSGTTTYVGQGGTFSFQAQDTISYQIVISHDGVDWDPANPLNRTLTGLTVDGYNEVVWDGMDNAGNPFPAGGGYQFEVQGRNGEVHFPFLDAENNLSGGPTVTKLNGDSAGSSTVYYDDRGYVTRGGTAVGNLNGHICGNDAWDQPVPNHSLLGVDSNDGNLNASGNYYRAWSGSDNSGSDCSGSTQYFGDAKGLDLWTYEASNPGPGTGGTFDIVDVADVMATVSPPATAVAGSTVNVLVGFGNAGSQTAADTSYWLNLPAGLTDVACSGATCNYDAGSGLVSVSGLPGSLSPDQWTNLVLSYTAPATGPVDVSAHVATSSNQGPNVAPDDANGSTGILASGAPGSDVADVATSVSPPAVAAPGDTVYVPVTFINLGPGTAYDVTYQVTLPPGLAGVLCSGATCNYDAGTGIVTITGLPNVLGSGEGADIVLNYTAPGAGNVDVTTQIGTSSDQGANNGPDSANGSTNVTQLGGGGQPPAVADVTVTVSPPATATPLLPVEVPVSFRNLGPLTANNVDYTLTLSPGLTGVFCEPNPPVSCAYDPGTGTVTVSGLPTTLGNGQSANFVLNYNGPDSGTVTVSATVDTSTAESNDANNSASAGTTFGEGAHAPTLHPIALGMLALLLMLLPAWQRRRHGLAA